MSLLDDQRSSRPGPRSQERTSEHGRAPLQGAGPVPARTAGQERAAPVPGATPQQLERVATIFEQGAPGRRAFVCPPIDVPLPAGAELLPPRLRRAEPPRLPEVSEPEIVRHYVRLSKRNFDLDSGFYPLGSCMRGLCFIVHDPSG